MSHLNVPRLLTASLPSNEWEAASELQTDLDMLEMYAFRFHSALALFDTAVSQMRPGQLNEDNWERAKIFQEWAAMAARDSALTIYHFRQTMHKANNKRKNCPAVKSDGRIMTEAIQIFTKFFPETKANRDAVGHEADALQTKTRNAAKGPVDLASIGLGQGKVENVMITGSLIGQRIMNTIEGQIVECELSSETLKKLLEVQGLIYRAFESEHNLRTEQPRR